MSLDVIVGGQAGDEGKGKIAAYLALKKDYDLCIRTGGPNAGHTIVQNGTKYPLKSISCGFVNEKSRLLIPAGSYIIVDWLLEEVEKLNLNEARLGIDYKTTIITPEQRGEERSDEHIMKEIGSVGTGLGTATIDKIMRNKGRKTRFAEYEPRLRHFLTDVSEEVNLALGCDGKVLIEGTQGLSLSLTHGDYPFVTSRDVTAASIMGEVGVSKADDIYLVFKPYVSRVGPGPLRDEIKDEQVLKNYHEQGCEVGTVSGRKRRIGSFEFNNAIKAVMLNSATKLAITHIDMLGEKNEKIRKMDDLTKEAREFVNYFKALSQIYPYPKLELISTGPDVKDMIDLSK